jgi:hypothetical protein
MQITIEEAASLFGLTLEELAEMSVSENCEYLIRTDDAEPQVVQILISDGYAGFMVIEDTIELTHIVPVNGEYITIPGGTLDEVTQVIEKVRNGEMETLH